MAGLSSSIRYSCDRLEYRCCVLGDSTSWSAISLFVSPCPRSVATSSSRLVSPATFAARPPSLWRYAELLPLPLDAEPVTLGEGMSPLVPCPRLGAQLGLQLPNHLVTTDNDGTERALAREKYYVPGSLLRARVNTAHPLAWGLGEEVDVMFSASPTFRLTDGADTKNLRRVGWFDGPLPLRSGWAWGQERLDGLETHSKLVSPRSESCFSDVRGLSREAPSRGVELRAPPTPSAPAWRSLARERPVSAQARSCS